MRDLPLVEVTLTLALAYLVFILGEHYLHVGDYNLDYSA